MANSFGYKYKRVLLDLVQVQITYEIVILPVEYIQKKCLLAFAFAQLSDVWDL